MRTKLPSTESLSEAQRAANEEHIARLDRAVAAGDWPLVLGCSKELCESVARQVVDATGGQVPNNIKMPRLLGQAREALDRQAGRGAATSLEMKRIAGPLATIVGEIAEARNTHGTGHGRTTSPEVIEEYALLAADAAVSWCRWALRRVDHVAIGRSASLQRLLVADTFKAGMLAAHLEALDIATLPEDEVRRLGIAVGRRASSGTFVVRIDGIDKIDSSEGWPSGYVVGVAEGAFWDDNGYLRTNTQTARSAIQALLSYGDEKTHTEFRDRAESLLGADMSYTMSLQDRVEVAATVEDLASSLDSSHIVRLTLRELAVAFRPAVRTEAHLAVWEDPMARFLRGSAEAQSSGGAFTLWEAITRIPPDRYPLSLSGRLFGYEELVRVAASLLYPGTALAPSAFAWLNNNRRLAREVVQVVESRGFEVDSITKALVDGESD